MKVNDCKTTVQMLIAKISYGSSGETGVSSADVERWRGWVTAGGRSFQTRGAASYLVPFRSYRNLLFKFWTLGVFEPPLGTCRVGQKSKPKTHDHNFVKS